ncbi:MAG: RNA-guided endonuclease InsQ/TnpB family protein, partial [Thermoplasmata archaeon]
MLIELKKKHPWLYEINSQSLQMSLRFLDNAFKRYLLQGLMEKLSEIKSINQIVITKDAGYYYCSIIYEKEGGIPERKPLSSENSIGIDLGLEKFATLSNGITIENPRFMKNVEKRIKKLQKQLSRKEKESNNRRKQI